MTDERFPGDQVSQEEIDQMQAEIRDDMGGHPAQEGSIVSPQECYEYFHDILRKQRPVTSVELIAQAHTGIMLYHVGMQISMLTQILMAEDKDDSPEGNEE